MHSMHTLTTPHTPTPLFQYPAQTVFLTLGAGGGRRVRSRGYHLLGGGERHGEGGEIRTAQPPSDLHDRVTA